MAYYPSPLEFERLMAVFEQTKNENEHKLEWWADVFTETDVYKTAQERGRCIFVGRKGAGKTALISGHIGEHHNRYLVHGAILADEFPFRALYEYFYKGFRSTIERIDPGGRDLPTIIQALQLSVFAWRKTFCCYAVLLLCSKIDELVDCSSSERRQLRQYQKQMERVADIRSNYDLPSLEGPLVFFFQQVQDIFESTFQEDFPDFAHFFAALTVRVASAVNERRPTDNLTEILEIASDLLKRNGKKILITLDKFDDYFDRNTYETNSDHPHEAAFMSDLLGGLFIAVRDIRRWTLFERIDLIITTPADRFYDLSMRERADLEARHVVNIDWYPKELYRFVNKRIAWALNLTDKKIVPWEYLFPITIRNCDSPDIREHSFLFFLRHTHWRPRDMQYYIHAILEDMQESGDVASDESFYRVISKVSRKIIKDGFLPEYRETYKKLEPLLEKLENISNVPTTISYDELKTYVRDYPYSHGSSIDQILYRLFEMGVIGVRKPRIREFKGINGTVRQNNEHVSYEFVYNARVRNPFDANSTIVFHPLFHDRLDLKHEDNYVIHELQWDMFDELKK